MRAKQAILILTASIMTVGLAGCRQKTKDYDIYFFSSRSEIVENLDKLTVEYEMKTGKRVKIFTTRTTENTETVCSGLKSGNYPTVFTSNVVTFEEWRSTGFAVGADGITNPELEALYEELPDTVRLQFDEEDSYGIPYSIEGYGLIADRWMTMDILGLDDTQTLQEDYVEAGYEEFRNMIVTMDASIKGKPGQTPTLSGKPYTAAGGESGIVKNLNGVLSTAGAERRTYDSCFGNYPINAVYEDIYGMRGADASKADQVLEPLVKSLQELNFLARHTASVDGPIERGPRFVNSTAAGYGQTVRTFVEGKAVFIKNGNWVCSNAVKVSEDVAESLMVLPMKLNFDDSDITMEGLDIKQMNHSIPEFVSQYCVINVKTIEQKRKDAEDSVLWLNTSKTGTDFIISRFTFVPFNADEHIELSNPLLNELINYKLRGNLLANPSDAAPATQGTEMYGKCLMEQLLTNPEDWSEEMLRGIAQEYIDY